MENPRKILDFGLILAIVMLSGVAWSQSQTISTLEEHVAQVTARVDARRPAATPQQGVATEEAGRPTAGTSEPGAATDAPVVARLVPTTPNDVAEVTPTPSAEFNAADPEVRGQLREVIAEEQEILREERWQKRNDRREERLVQRVAALADKTGMDSTTTTRLSDLLVVEQAEASELFRQAREDFSWDEAREKVTSLRAETDEKAKALLEESEYKEYEEMRTEDNNRWNRGRRASNAPRGNSNESTR